MDFGLLEKSEHMKPLLVKLYDTHHVYKCAGNSKPKAQYELGNVVSELLDASTQEQEKELVTDIILALVKQAGINLRKSLAEKLANSNDIPSRLVLSFAYDEIEVAEKVLKNSPVLDVLDLMYIIQSKSEKYWQAIAYRSDLPNSIVDELSSLGDVDTHSILAGNDNILISDMAMGNLLESSKKSDAVAKALIERSDVPKSIVKNIYEYVGDHLQSIIRSKYGIIGDRVEKVISDTVSDTLKEINGNPYLPSNALMQSEIAKSNIRPEKNGEARRFMLDDIFEVLNLKNYKSFVAKLSVFMGIGSEDTLEVLSQKYGHGLAILCKAHGVDRSRFIKMFLLTDVMRSNDRVMQGTTLSRALAYYDKLSVDIAREIYQKSFTVS